VVESVVLSDRVALAQRHYRACGLCEHRCGVDRLAGEVGPCKAGVTPRVFRHRVEYGEELDLVPSHLFYLSGCDLRCAFCIAGLDAFDPRRGRELTGDFFNDAVAWGREQGARNIQWVGGEPTIHLPAILEVMSRCPVLPPVVWKSDFHCTPDALSLLDGVADVYLADFKFGNDECARRVCGVDNYVSILQRNLKIAETQGRLIVRHLLLPGHADCCLRPIVGWMAEHLPTAEFSLRDGYLPAWRAQRMVGLNVSNSRAEIAAAHRIVRDARLEVIQ
jgi:putative pyruvate formate lyase activating enzyme